MRRVFLQTLLATSVFILSACAPPPEGWRPSAELAFTSPTGQTFLHRHVPVFLVEDSHQSYNLIGSPVVTTQSANEIVIDPGTPVIFAEQRHFTTDKASYTNLVYRVHFERVPYQHLTGGRNIGLFIIVTLNNTGTPLLYTTVHTCGCYLAFLPTSALPEEAFPNDWPNEGRQAVYGEALPVRLELFDPPTEEMHLAVRLKSGTHRVRDAWLQPARDGESGFHYVDAPLRPLQDLERLPHVHDDAEPVSFYTPEGTRKGYVVGSNKPWERLLMSWWVFDWYIGEDKRLGSTPTDGPVFYTSLKPWARDDSDMRDFMRFLRYWGWGL